MIDRYERVGKAIAALQALPLPLDLVPIVDHLAIELAEYRADMDMIARRFPDLMDRPPLPEQVDNGIEVEAQVAGMCAMLGLDYVALTTDDDD